MVDGIFLIGVDVAEAEADAVTEAEVAADAIYF